MSPKEPPKTWDPESEFSKIAPQDAGHVILTAALLEVWLERLLLNSKPMSNAKAKALFDDRGALRSFASKIKVAYAFDLIDATVYRDLEAIRGVRNAFAHPRAYLTFEHDEVRAKMVKFKDWDDSDRPKRFFNVRTLMCVDAIKEKIDKLVWEHASPD